MKQEFMLLSTAKMALLSLLTLDFSADAMWVRPVIESTFLCQVKFTFDKNMHSLKSRL